MKTIRKIQPDLQVNYPLWELAPLEKILFLDIETTGFSAKTSHLYLIGCVYYANDVWNTIQWFAEDSTEEDAVLEAFFEFNKSYTFLIHFNGNNFDIPYLEQKCKALGLPYSLSRFQGIDIYRRIAPFKDFLKLSDCKQKSIEKYLRLNRKDTYSGGELITLYHSYRKTREDRILYTLLLHNEDDIRGMVSISGALSIADLFYLPFKVKKVQANYYIDVTGQEKGEVVMSLKLQHPLPIPISNHSHDCYFAGSETKAKIRVPIVQDTLKYFYPNYREYYYLPEEDTAMHKSVASFVDRNYREQATAANCYTKKTSRFLPQWNEVISPSFKRDYKSSELFFELTDELKTNREAFRLYAEHILQMMIL